MLRETALAENIPGGYPTIYPALKTMEDGGWVRRGMFVGGLGAAQFAMPAAVDRLRSLRSERDALDVLFLAATDPANPYGTVLPWPRKDGDATADHPANLADANPVPADDRDTVMAGAASFAGGDSAITSHGMSRTSGAGVVLINGSLTAFLRRRSQEVQVFLPESEPERTRFARELAKKFDDLQDAINASAPHPVTYIFADLIKHVLSAVHEVNERLANFNADAKAPPAE